MDKLLPCPFCGGEAKTIVNKSTQGQTARTSCETCSCSKTMVRHPNYEGDIEADSITGWNRRAKPEEVQP